MRSILARSFDLYSISCTSAMDIIRFWASENTLFTVSSLTCLICRPNRLWITCMLFFTLWWISRRSTSFSFNLIVTSSSARFRSLTSAVRCSFARDSSEVLSSTSSSRRSRYFRFSFSSSVFSSLSAFNLAAFPTTFLIASRFTGFER